MTLLLFLGLLLMGCGSAETDSDNPDLATDYTLPTLTGDDLTLSDLRGQYVLLNFWATWCIPCRAEMPYLQAISVEHQDQLVVLGINLGESADRVEPFVEEFGLTFPVLLDPPEAMKTEHGVRGLPVSVVIDPEGHVAWRRAGEIDVDAFDQWLGDNLVNAQK